MTKLMRSCDPIMLDILEHFGVSSACCATGCRGSAQCLLRVLAQTGRMYYIFFIYSSVEEHLVCLQFLAISNKIAMNIVEDVSLWNDEASFGYMLRIGIARS